MAVVIPLTGVLWWYRGHFNNANLDMERISNAGMGPMFADLGEVSSNHATYGVTVGAFRCSARAYPLFMLIVAMR